MEPDAGGCLGSALYALSGFSGHGGGAGGRREAASYRGSRTRGGLLRRRRCWKLPRAYILERPSSLRW